MILPTDVAHTIKNSIQQTSGDKLFALSSQYISYLTLAICNNISKKNCQKGEKLNDHNAHYPKTQNYKIIKYRIAKVIQS